MKNSMKNLPSNIIDNIYAFYNPYKRKYSNITQEITQIIPLYLGINYYNQVIDGSTTTECDKWYEYEIRTDYYAFLQPMYDSNTSHISAAYSSTSTICLTRNYISTVFDIINYWRTNRPLDNSAK